jgi:hypothetical protein
VLGTLKETFGAKDAGTIVTEAQKLAAEKAQQEAANPKAPIVGTPTDNFGGDIIAKPEAPVDNFKGLLTKETPTIPIQDSKTVDLTKPQTPIEDIKAPDTRTPMDAIADKVNKGTPVQDILPPKTPVTVNGADFKVTQDTGAPMVKVVDLKTGNETEVPRTEIKTGTTRLLKPIEGTGEFSNFKLSKNVEASSIENGLAETLGDLPGSNKVDMADQAQKVADYINKNPDDAREVALGHKAAPKGIIPEAVFKAFTDIAREQGDGELAKDLANSELAGQARTMGVRLQALRGVNPEDPTEAIKQLQEAREKAQVKQSAIESKKLDDAVNKAKSDRQTGKVKMDWNSFVDSIKC